MPNLIEKEPLGSSRKIPDIARPFVNLTTTIVSTRLVISFFILFIRSKRPRWDLNPQPPGLESAALHIELQGHVVITSITRKIEKVNLHHNYSEGLLLI